MRLVRSALVRSAQQLRQRHFAADGMGELSASNAYYSGKWWIESERDRSAGEGLDVALEIDFDHDTFRMGMVATLTDSAVFVSTFSSALFNGEMVQEKEEGPAKMQFPRHRLPLTYDGATEPPGAMMIPDAGLVGSIGDSEMVLTLGEMKIDALPLHVSTCQPEREGSARILLNRVPFVAVSDIFALSADHSVEEEDGMHLWERESIQENALRRWARKKRRERHARRSRMGHQPRSPTVW